MVQDGKGKEGEGEMMVGWGVDSLSKMGRRTARE